MQLSWKPGFSLSRKPVKRSIARRGKWGASKNADGAQQFELIAEHPAGDHDAGRSSSVIDPAHLETPVGNIINCQASSDLNTISLCLAEYPKDKHAGGSDEHGTHPQDEAVDRAATFIETLLWDSNDTSPRGSCESPCLETIHGMTGLRSYPCNSKEQRASLLLPGLVIPGPATDEELQISEGNRIDFSIYYERTSQVTDVKPSSAAIQSLPNVSYSPSAFIPPNVLYNSLSQRFKPVLERCMHILHMSALAIVH